MVTTRGFKTGVIYKAESAYGTPVTVDTFIQGKVKNHSAELNNNMIIEQGLGEGRNATYYGWGPFDAAGTIEGLVGRFDFFAHLIGARSGAGTAASMYVLTEGDNVGFTGNDIKSFTMQVGSEEGATDWVDTYSGCLLTSATFTCEEGQPLRFSSEWVAQKLTNATAIVAYVADTTAIWFYQQGTLKWGASPTALAKVTSASITVSNNLFIYRALGSRFIQQPETGLRRYTWTATLKGTTEIMTTIIQDFYGQASTPHEGVTAAGPTASNEFQMYFTGPTNQAAYIQLDEAVVDRITKTVELEGGIIEVTCEGHAMKGLANTPIKWQVSA